MELETKIESMRALLELLNELDKPNGCVQKLGSDDSDDISNIYKSQKDINIRLSSIEDKISRIVDVFEFNIQDLKDKIDVILSRSNSLIKISTKQNVFLDFDSAKQEVLNFFQNHNKTAQPAYVMRRLNKTIDKDKKQVRNAILSLLHEGKLRNVARGHYEIVREQEE